MTPPQNCLYPDFHNSDILIFLPAHCPCGEFCRISSHGAEVQHPGRHRHKFPNNIVLLAAQFPLLPARARRQAPGTRRYVCQVSTGTTNELKTLNIGNIFTSPPSFVQSCMHQHQQERGSLFMTSMYINIINGEGADSGFLHCHT